MKAKLARGTRFPTPWNQLETGILFALDLPLLVFREKGVSGGVFDHGVTDVFIHEMPTGRVAPTKRRALREIIRKWSADVQVRYYARK
jgi:hypothetical protein